MGGDLETSQFTSEDFERFRQNLIQETKILQKWFSENLFLEKKKSAGVELETWMIGRNFFPVPSNEGLIKLLKHPFIVPELSRFNLEFNITPFPVEHRFLRNFHEDLEQYWANCNACAANLDAQMLMIGILPTVRSEDLTLKNMSPLARYKALNEQVMALRKGKPIRLDIKGKDHLKITRRDVMLESAATSLQIHLEINPQEAVRFYNASHILSAPMVAAGANSPFLFGKDLWDETRILLFEQAVSVKNLGIFKNKIHDRVIFGRGFARNSLMEIFSENLEIFPVLLPMVKNNNPKELNHLKLHNGTIWRWNRPLIGKGKDGKLHLRIEHRVVAAGPSICDIVANIALYLGMVQFYSTIENPLEFEISFSQAKDNFYRAAKNGLKAQVKWTNGIRGTLQSLLLEELIPNAKEGLRALKVDSEDIEYYLENIMKKRVSSGQNGATWQRTYVEQHGYHFQDLTDAYAYHQQKGKPVHEWNLKQKPRPRVTPKQRDPACKLQILQSLPNRFLEVPPEKLFEILSGPTLIHLEGIRKKPYFISLLLHGNETTGFLAIQAVLKKYQSKKRKLPRSLSLFVGNVLAAKEGVRKLDHQLDYNRVWKGGNQPEHEMAQAVLEEMKWKKIFAAIDIHNNTGKNPHFACINRLQKEEFFHLALLFSRKVVFFLNPDTVLTTAFSKLCPTVVLECGQPGVITGTEAVQQYLEDCIRLAEIPDKQIIPQDIDFFESVGRIQVPVGLTFTFNEHNKEANFRFLPTLDHLNFCDLPEKTLIGWLGPNKRAKLSVTDRYKDQVGDKYFIYEGGEIRTKIPLIPSMFTLDQKIIRQDCLGYVMKRKAIPIRKKKRKKSLRKR